MHESDVERGGSVSRPSRAAALCSATWERPGLVGAPSEWAGADYAVLDRDGRCIFTMATVVTCWHLWKAFWTLWINFSPSVPENVWRKMQIGQGNQNIQQRRGAAAVQPSSSPQNVPLAQSWYIQGWQDIRRSHEPRKQIHNFISL